MTGRNEEHNSKELVRITLDGISMEVEAGHDDSRGGDECWYIDTDAVVITAG